MSSSPTYHKNNHDGQSIRYLIGRFYEDDSEADCHAHYTAQEGASSHQGEGAGVDVGVAQAERKQSQLMRGPS